jgi:outer membrane receptor for ferrienterochelin and colicins
MKQKLLLSAVFIFISICIYAQDSVTVTGKILDENKQPLPGATIIVKGTGIGTATDDAGKYILRVPKDARVLVISYVGYANKEVPIVPGQTTYEINTQMQGVENSLNQVVVSASKSKEKLLDAPASISIVGQDEIQRNVVTTLVDELATTPGVDVMKTGLISRNVVVRGFNDIFSGTVLNVVDDRIGSVPSLQVNAYQLVPVSDLDVEKIEVLRGPASALYGPNAAGGVISIITKSPLDQEKQFETTVAMNSGFTVLDKSLQQYNNGKPISGNIINPEIRNSGKFLDGKIGYKISAVRLPITIVPAKWIPLTGRI